MKRLLDILIFLLLPAMFSSCVDNKYDLEDIDDSGGLSPSLVLPIGTLNTGIMDFLEGAGIPKDLLHTTSNGDTIYVVYTGSMQLTPTSLISWPGSGIIEPIPSGIGFAFDGGSESIDIGIFKDLEPGSTIRPSNPRISCMIRNYIGADITVDINSITSEGNGPPKQAKFINGESSYSIDLGKAPAHNEYSSQNVIFDKTNGQMDSLFSNSPEHILYDFSVDLTVSEDGFIVRDKYVDVDYEVRIPLTFAQGTQLVHANTLDFDLSGDDFINNIENLTLWIEYENSLRTQVDLEVLFLDENKNEIESIAPRNFHMNAASVSSEPFSLSFNSNELDEARKARYAVLKSTLKTVGVGEVNIHPDDYIKLKLSAYSKVNI
ncbi:MAG: hypothetical protein LBK58_04510 [Prevotellaceae bacterium]|jgi:hypothetical protein|nr:hypothetical protein [Prevotellaceae bacterium]